MNSVPGTLNSNPFNLAVIQEFRENGGRVRDFAGIPLLLLTTRGARSGLIRTTPLVYLEDGGRLVVFASNGGAPAAPGWYHNLRAGGGATVEKGTERFPVRHELVPGPEHDRLWELQIAQDPNFATFRGRTSRVVPVVALLRTEPPAA